MLIQTIKRFVLTYVEYICGYTLKDWITIFVLKTPFYELFFHDTLIILYLLDIIKLYHLAFIFHIMLNV